MLKSKAIKTLVREDQIKKSVREHEGARRPLVRNAPLQTVKNFLSFGRAGDFKGIFHSQAGPESGGVELVGHGLGL